MTDEPDLYRMLEVHPSADASAIRAAYRRLARRFHPDVASPAQLDDARRMSEINRAWEILRDPERRSAYDRRRSAPTSGYVAPRPAARSGTGYAHRPGDARPAGDGGHGAGAHGRSTPTARGFARGAASPAGSSESPGSPGRPGRPPGQPSGTMLTFGRYAGWSLGEIARRDPDFLEWLERTPSGRPYRDEIDALLRRLGRRAPGADPLARPGRFRA